MKPTLKDKPDIADFLHAPEGSQKQNISKSATTLAPKADTAKESGEAKPKKVQRRKAKPEPSEAISKPAVPMKFERRITKTIRLALNLERDIKDICVRRYEETGQRVTESDIIQEAIVQYLNNLGG